jgi:hypothetical protein
MIVCPNCSYANPDGAVQCESCYTPLPTMINCPSCGATVQSDASFCGQCGFNLKTVTPPVKMPESSEPQANPVVPDPLVPPDPLMFSEPPTVGSPAPAGPPTVTPPMPVAGTQLQLSSARLLHLQTNVEIELPPGLPVIHIGKPNDRIPPDVDVSGFPNSDIVSRIHADLRIEGDAYYIEDVGSSNGTYINNVPLSMGNRHRLRSGDRVALGKGDKVTFLFQQG